MTSHAPAEATSLPATAPIGPGTRRRPSMSRGVRPSRNELVAAASAGILFALAFPPLPFTVVAFVCLVPLAVRVAAAADNGEVAGVAARVGAWFAIVGFGLSL